MTAVQPHNVTAGVQAGAGAAALDAVVVPVATGAGARLIPAPPAPFASVMRGALALLGTQPLTWAAALLTIVFVPHYVGAATYGQYALAMSVALLAGAAVSLGVPEYLVRRVAKHPQRIAVDSGAAMVLLLGLATLAALALAALLPLAHLALRSLLLDIVLLGMAVSAGERVLLALLRAQERHARFAWLLAIGSVAGSLAGVGALAAGGGVTAFAIAVVLGSAAVTVWGWQSSGFRLLPAALSPRLWWELARGGLPFMGLSLVTGVYGTIDNLLLAALSRAEVIGWYAAAYNIISIPVFIPTLITTPLFPVLSRHAGDRPVFRLVLQRSIATALILSAPACGLIVALAPSIPAVLHWSPAFQHSIVLIQILALHQPVVAVDMVIGTALVALSRERRWLGVAVAAAIFNPSLNLLLIPLYERHGHNGAIGASIVTVATELLVGCGALRLLPAGFIGRETAGVALRVLLASVCLGVVTAILRSFSLPLAVLAGVAAYCAAGTVLQLWSTENMRTVRGIAGRSLHSRATSSWLTGAAGHEAACPDAHLDGAPLFEGHEARNGPPQGVLATFDRLLHDLAVEPEDEALLYLWMDQPNLATASGRITPTRRQFWRRLLSMAGMATPNRTGNG